MIFVIFKKAFPQKKALQKVQKVVLLVEAKKPNKLYQKSIEN